MMTQRFKMVLLGYCLLFASIVFGSEPILTKPSVVDKMVVMSQKDKTATNIAIMVSGESEENKAFLLQVNGKFYSKFFEDFDSIHDVQLHSYPNGFCIDIENGANYTRNSKVFFKIESKQSIRLEKIETYIPRMNKGYEEYTRYEFQEIDDFLLGNIKVASVLFGV
jgi:hypothetical protein